MKQGEQIRNGLVIPGTSENSAANKGTVESLGLEVELPIQEGDVVVFSKHSGTHLDDDVYSLLDEELLAYE